MQQSPQVRGQFLLTSPQCTEKLLVGGLDERHGTFDDLAPGLCEGEVLDPTVREIRATLYVAFGDEVSRDLGSHHRVGPGMSLEPGLGQRLAVAGELGDAGKDHELRLGQVDLLEGRLYAPLPYARNLPE